MMLAARDLFDSREDALLAGLLLSLSSTNIYFSREIRMYSLYMLLAAVSMWGMIRILKQRKHGMGMAVGANMLLVWTHAMSFTLFVLEGVMVVAFYWRDFKRMLVWLFPQAVNILVWYALWARRFSLRKIDGAAQGKLFTIWDLRKLVDSWICGMFRMDGWSAADRTVLVYGMLLASVVLLLLASLVIVSKRRLQGRTDWAEFFVLAVALTPVVGFIFSRCVYPAWVPRYTIYSSFGLVLGMILGTRSVSFIGKGMVSQERVAAVRACMAVLLVCAFFQAWLKIPSPINFDWKTAARAVSDEQPVYVYPGNQTPCVRRNLPHNPVVPIYDAATSSVPDGAWLVVFTVDARRSSPRQKSRFDAILVQSICRPPFSIDVWKRLPKNAAPEQHALAMPVSAQRGGQSPRP
jgi:hypothetical protein